MIYRKVNLNYKKPKPVISIKEPEFKRIVRKDSLETLRKKIRLGHFIIGFIALNPDPRGLDRIKQLQMEQQWLREVIAEKEEARRKPKPKPILLPGQSDGPPPQVIKLDTLKLFTDLNK